MWKPFRFRIFIEFIIDFKWVNKSEKKFDFVYSFDVIDHVYDIDGFISNIIDTTRKYAYVNAYRGYFPELKDHKSIYRDNEGIYMNDISVERIKNVMLEKGLTEKEFCFRSQLKRDKVLYDGDLGRAWNRFRVVRLETRTCQGQRLRLQVLCQGKQILRIPGSNLE